MHIQYAYMQTCRQTRNFVFIVYIRMIVPAAEEGNMGHMKERSYRYGYSYCRKNQYFDSEW